jgi:hypothetical protein
MILNNGELDDLWKSEIIVLQLYQRGHNGMVRSLHWRNLKFEQNIYEVIFYKVTIGGHLV